MSRNANPPGNELNSIERFCCRSARSQLNLQPGAESPASPGVALATSAEVSQPSKQCHETKSDAVLPNVVGRQFSPFFGNQPRIGMLAAQAVELSLRPPLANPGRGLRPGCMLFDR